MSKLKKFKGALKWKGTKSIEFKILRVTGTAFMYLLLISYLVFNGMHAWEWAKIKYIRMQDPKLLESALQYSVQHNNMQAAALWLKAMPRRDSPYILSIIKPYTPKLPTEAFLSLARRANHINDREQKLFWLMMFRFRLQYDVRRCGTNDDKGFSEEIIEILYQVNAISKSNVFEMSSDLEENIRMTRQVLDFDTQYPADNNPEKVCDFIAKLQSSHAQVLDEFFWPRIRFNLRHTTDLSLRKSKEELNKKTPEETTP